MREFPLRSLMTALLTTTLFAAPAAHALFFFDCGRYRLQGSLLLDDPKAPTLVLFKGTLSEKRLIVSLSDDVRAQLSKLKKGQPFYSEFEVLVREPGTEPGPGKVAVRRVLTGGSPTEAGDARAIRLEEKLGCKP